MTHKIYETDSYCKSFDATVLSCEKNGEYFEVILDKTAFFAEGGGQAADTGKINGIEVLDVKEKGENIVHFAASHIEKGETVHCEIDWDKRFSRMQSHSGEHIVSGIVHSLFGYSNIGFHMGEDSMQVDFSGVLTPENIAEVETKCNEAIYKNLPITAYFPEKEELKKIDYRSKLDLESGVRLVTIEGVDVCACCAPHVSKTGEIGLIKIIDSAPNKKGTRLFVLAGIEALKDYCKLNASNKALMHHFSAMRDNVIDKAKREREEKEALRAENKALSERLALLELKTEKIASSICGFCDNATYDTLRFCSNNISEKESPDYCLLFSQTEDGFIYTASSKNLDVNPIVKSLNSAFSGRGGGKKEFAQGKISEGSKEQITEFLKGVF